MNLHANAALSWTGRRRLCELVVDEGWTVVSAASAAGVSVRCARKWIGRYRLEGLAGLYDRASATLGSTTTAPSRISPVDDDGPSATSTSTSPSTTTAGSPTPRYSRTRRPRQLSASFGALLPSTAATASRSNGS